MSLTDIEPGTNPDANAPNRRRFRGAGPDPPTRRWPAGAAGGMRPTLDMGLGSILGGRPTAAAPAALRRAGPLATRPHREVSASPIGATGPIEPEATVFTNIASGSADVVRPWVEALRNVGFAVFAKPKVDEDSDVDSDMLDHIALRRREGLAAVVVASADGQAFRQPLEEIARDDGTPVTVLGFREHASWALASDSLSSSIWRTSPACWEPLPRIGLDSLPEQGPGAAVPAAVLADVANLNSRMTNEAAPPNGAPRREREER